MAMAAGGKTCRRIRTEPCLRPTTSSSSEEEDSRANDLPQQTYIVLVEYQLSGSPPCLKLLFLGKQMLNVSIDVSFSMVGQPKTMDGFRSFLALHATLFDCLNVCCLLIGMDGSTGSIGTYTRLWKCDALMVRGVFIYFLPTFFWSYVMIFSSDKILILGTPIHYILLLLML